MIVVVIIGVLASIMIPNYLQFACRSKRTEAPAILGAMRSFQIIYKHDHGHYFIENEPSKLAQAGFEYSGIQYSLITFTGGIGPPPWFIATVQSTWAGTGGVDRWTVNEQGTLVAENNGCGN